MKKYKQNQRVGKLILIEIIPERKNKYNIWKCQCDCGNEVFRNVGELHWPKNQTCGCDHPYKDLIGKIYNELTVKEFSYKKQNGDYFFKCKCRCGTYKTVRRAHLIDGHTKSCGCIASEIGSKSKSWKGYGEISKLCWNNIVNSANARNLEINITIEYIWDLFLQQNRRCALSNQELTMLHSIHKKIYKTASLDRIDSTKGYIKGNVQWIHKDINFMKQAFSQDYFLELCRKIVYSQDKKESN